MQEAHARGLRVITELVLNHTSDQHPWFQRARRASPAAASGTFTSGAIRQTSTRTRASSSRISNRRTGPGTRWPSAYYWHRFYAHQPDLNFDNPQVASAILQVLRFLARTWAWMVSGSTPCPISTSAKGTNCENLPETHAFLKELRRHVDANYPGPHVSGRGQSVAGRCGRLLRGRATNATWPFTSRSCRACSWRCAWKTASRSSTFCEQTPADSGELPVGPLSAQSRRTDPGNGHR